LLLLIDGIDGVVESSYVYYYSYVQKLFPSVNAPLEVMILVFDGFVMDLRQPFGEFDL